MTDELTRLWQTEEKPVDPSRVLGIIERNHRQQVRFVYLTYAVGALALAMVLWVDLQGGFIVPGIVPVFVAGSIVWQWFKVRRAKRRCPAAAEMNPGEMLRHAERHARVTLRNARIAYGVFPASVLAGILAGPLLTNREADLEGSGAFLLIAGPLVALSLALAIGYGSRVAAFKRQEIETLQARRRELEEGL